MHEDSPEGTAVVGHSNLEDAKLRRSEQYHLVTKEKLSDAHRGQIGSLADHPDFCALVLPKDSAASAKAIDYDAAVLLSLLRRPRSLPDRFSDSASRRSVLRLILDGILEIEIEREFVSGREAYNLLSFPTYSPSEHPSRTAELSRQAIRFGIRLNIQDAATLATRLYTFNRQPPTPQFSRRFATAEAIRKHLQINPPWPQDWRGWEEDSKNTSEDGRKQAEVDSYWTVFHPRDSAHRIDRSTTSGHKIYVSPRPCRLPEVFDTVIGAISPEHVYSFKVARHPWGLLRPDKFVLYLRDESSFRQTARVLKSAFSDLSGQGVPFTGGIAEGSLLSWGKDPSVGEFDAEWREPGSWRVLISNTLAQAIVDARRWELDSPETYALTRVRLEGVDPQTWTPD